MNTIVFDKTGTLTDGKPKVVDTMVMGEDDVRIRECKIIMLHKALKACEHNSEHPIAKVIENYCRN